MYLLAENCGFSESIFGVFWTNYKKVVINFEKINELVQIR